MKKQKLTDGQKTLIRRLLKEYLQSYVIIGFDLTGKSLRICEFETDIQSCALAEVVRSEYNQNTQAQEVWVRNLEKDDIP